MRQNGHRLRAFSGAAIWVVIAFAVLGTAQCRGASEQAKGKSRQEETASRLAAVESPGKKVASPERDRGKKIEKRSWLDDEPESERAGEPDKQPEAPGEDRASSTGQPSRRRCSLRGEQARRVWPTPAPVTIEAAIGRFVVAGYSRTKDEERVFVVGIAPGKRARPLTTVRLEKAHPGLRVAPPGMSVRDGVRALLAVSDGSGDVLVGAMPLDRATAGLELARIGAGADTRFSPAVTHLSGLSAVAWSVGTTPMRTQVALLDPGGRVMAIHDVTPEGMGASAPAFVDGSEFPLLLALDAHEGYSPLLRIPFSATGVPAQAEVVIPLNLIATPPRLAAARASFGVFVGYTALGSAATSAVGLLRIEPETGPVRALVPGTGYGRLQVDAVAGLRALLFAADAPLQKGDKRPGEIRVRVVDDRGMGPVLPVRGPDGTAEGPALAYGDDGTVALAFSTPSGVYVHWLACDDR